MDSITASWARAGTEPAPATVTTAAAAKEAAARNLPMDLPMDFMGQLFPVLCACVANVESQGEAPLRSDRLGSAVFCL